MWRWQLNELDPRTVIKGKLLGVSLGLHCLILILLFIVYRGYYAQLDITINQTQVPVIFMPLHKKLHTHNHGTSRAHKKQTRAATAHKRALPQPATALAAEKKVAKKKIVPKRQKKNEQKKK